jgi:ribonuclease-3
LKLQYLGLPFIFSFAANQFGLLAYLDKKEPIAYYKVETDRVVLALAELATLQSTLGVTFQDPLLLQQALTHRSFLNENPDFPLPSNERLEFLGDALLGFVVAEKLHSDLPHLWEGALTVLRAALVCNETLARIASSFHLGDHLYLGRGEEMSGGRHRQSNLSSALEAVIGAIFKITEEESIEESIKDYKSKLQVLVQAEQQTTPVYRIVEEKGPAHDKLFTVEVVVGDAVLGRGSGKGKRAAEQKAAQAALENWAK